MDINSLLNNNSILQYMSGIGSAISEGKSPATAMNQITQQQLGAQSKVKMQNNYLAQLKDIIGGTDASATVVKKPSNITVTPDGIKHTIPWDAVNNPNTDTIGLMKQITDAGNPLPETPIVEAPIIPTTPQVSAPLKSPVGGATLNGQAMSQVERQAAMAALSGDPTLNSGTYGVLAKDMLNPSTRPLSINGADLAGLSSADVSQALHDTLGVEHSRQTALMNAGQLINNQDTLGIRNTEARIKMIEEYRKLKEIPREVPVDIGGGRTIMVKPEAALTHYTSMNKLPVSFETYKLAMGDPEFKGYLLEMAKAGSTSVNLGPLENAIQGGKGRSVSDVLAPDYGAKIEKELSNDPNYRWSSNIDKLVKEKGMTVEAAEARHKWVMKVQKMDEGVKQAYQAMGKEAIRGKDGWYVDGVKVRNYPQ